MDILHPTLGRVSSFSNDRDAFFFLNIRDLQNFPFSTVSCRLPHRPLMLWLPVSGRPPWGMWALTEIASPTLQSFPISKEIFILCRDETKNR